MSIDHKELFENEGNDFPTENSAVERVSIKGSDGRVETVVSGAVLSTKSGYVVFKHIGKLDNNGRVTSLVVTDVDSDVKYELQEHRITGIIKSSV